MLGFPVNIISYLRALQVKNKYMSFIDLGGFLRANVRGKLALVVFLLLGEETIIAA